MTQYESFNRLMYDLACVRAQEPENSMCETGAQTDFEILVELSRLSGKQASQSCGDQDLCLICGEQQCVVKDYQEWIQCEQCSRWVHQYCDGILNAALTEQLQYECPVCRLLRLRKHPCNVNEELGRDPRFQEAERGVKKARRRRPSTLSDSETNETATHASRGVRDTERGRGGHPGAQALQTAPHDPTPEPPPFSMAELATIRLLGYSNDMSGANTIEERNQSVERKKSSGVESTAQNILSYINGSFNHLRYPISHTFHNLQRQARQDAMAVQPSIDYHHTDVSFAHVLALFQQNKLEYEEAALEGAGGAWIGPGSLGGPGGLGAPGGPGGAVVQGTMPGTKRSTQEAEGERRRQEMACSEISNYELAAFRPRRSASLFAPILRLDADLRAAAALAIFDAFLQAIERNRLEYVKTLLPAAAQACWIYQQQAPAQALADSQSSAQAPHHRHVTSGFQGCTNGIPCQGCPNCSSAPQHGLQTHPEFISTGQSNAHAPGSYHNTQEYHVPTGPANMPDDVRGLDLTDSVVRRRMSAENFVRAAEKVLSTAGPAAEFLRLGHDGYLPESALLHPDPRSIASQVNHTIFAPVAQVGGAPNGQVGSQSAQISLQSAQNAQHVQGSDNLLSGGTISASNAFPALPPIPTSGPFSVPGSSQSQQATGDQNQANKQLAPPPLLNTRQWFDLKSRGVEQYVGVGLVRMTLLQAMVNVGLGMNVFEKVFGAPLTEHLIRFGVRSSRAHLERQLRSGAFHSHVEVGCLYETLRRGVDMEVSTPGEMGGGGGVSLGLSDDQDIADWDILETPTSVVWALRLVGHVVALFDAEAGAAFGQEPPAGSPLQV